MKNKPTDPLLLRSLPVVSARSLRELEEMGEEFFVELKATFIEDLSVLVENIQNALNGRDAQGVDYAAHSLRGICSNFGAARLPATGAEIVRLANSGAWDEAGSLLPRLREALREVEVALASSSGQPREKPGD